MQIRRKSLLIAVTLAALAASGARAEGPLSAAAHAGLVFPVGQRYGGTALGGWAELMYAPVTHWSVGAEAGYFDLSDPSTPVMTFTGPYPTGFSRDMVSYSVLFRGRSDGPLRVHITTGVGYYQLRTRTHFAQSDDRIEQQWNPGYSLGVGLSGAGLVRPSFQLRLHETIGPNDTNMDLVTFEAGLHFN